MRTLRLGCAALVVAAALAGCADVEPSSEAPTTPAASSSVEPSTDRPSGAVPSVSAGGEGLDVRYLDEDGTVKTLRVEDFPR